MSIKNLFDELFSTLIDKFRHVKRSKFVDLCACLSQAKRHFSQKFDFRASDVKKGFPE